MSTPLRAGGTAQKRESTRFHRVSLNHKKQFQKSHFISWFQLQNIVDDFLLQQLLFALDAVIVVADAVIVAADAVAVTAAAAVAVVTIQVQQED